MKTYLRVILLFLILLISLHIGYSSCIYAQEEPAEINAYITGELLPIQSAQWTPIDITLEDRAGINWTHFQIEFFNDSKPFEKYYNRVMWHILLYPMPVYRYLGYNTLHLTPEVIEGNPAGWFLRVSPNTIIKTTTGFVHPITLEIRTEDSLIDYAVTIGINITRYDVLGDPMGSSYIYIPVRASPLNNLKLDVTDSTQSTDISQVASYDFFVTNRGNYRDVFQFDVEADAKIIGVLDQQVLVLDPGETQPMSLNVISNDIVIDFGTAHKITIYAFSDGDPTKVEVGSFIVVTQGVLITQNMVILSSLLALIVVIIFILLYVKLRRDVSVWGKPNKPWKIPVEEEYLISLKKSNRSEYVIVRRMMQQEYQSAVLWYKSYNQQINKKQSRTKNDTKMKKPEKIQFASQKKSDKTRERNVINAQVKEKIMKRIVREQQKQKRKLDS